jgi:hypothetical protein
MPVWATKWNPVSKTNKQAGCLWFTLIILATQEAEIKKIVVPNQPGAISS